MNDKDDLLESNTARLIQAGYGCDARPDPAVHQRVFSRLAAELREKSAEADFPAAALGLLAALGGLLTVWASVQLGELGLRVLENGQWVALALPLSANLLLAPAASFVIIFKRRKHG